MTVFKVFITELYCNQIYIKSMRLRLYLPSITSAHISNRVKLFFHHSSIIISCDQTDLVLGALNIKFFI